ncbi:hypothetical protein CTheo_7665 [Ceratobasidium theobromae]|uniref:Uncharacterized protein n=1 Tax=Ceratobasidium theobromae TaxID=1582974 RepID=A0A5N5QB76_9AGAM|nr:hypothetical protein CTheo_7665 [Ceratobasidium theobromae]
MAIPAVTLAVAGLGESSMDLDIIMDDPWDNPTFPGIGGPPSPVLSAVDEDTAYWGNVDDLNTSADISTGVPTQASNAGNFLDEGEALFGSPHLFDLSPSIHSVKDDSELFPLLDFELEPQVADTSNTPVEQNGSEPNPQLNKICQIPGDLWRGDLSPEHSRETSPPSGELVGFPDEGDGPKDTPNLPDGLWAIQELVAYLSSHGKLTVQGAEEILKLLDFCFKNGMLEIDIALATGLA